MIKILIYLASSGLAAFCAKKYSATKNASYLNCSAFLVYCIAFCLTIGAGYDAVLDKAEEPRVFYTAFFSGAVAAGLTAWGREGWRKLIPAAHLLLFCWVAIFSAFCLNYFHELVYDIETSQALYKAVPGSGREAIRAMSPERQAAMAKKFGELLPTADKYVRWGMIRRLKYMAGAEEAVPALIPVIQEADYDTLRDIRKLLETLGRKAAAAAPALRARLPEYEKYPYEVEDIKKLLAVMETPAPEERQELKPAAGDAAR